MSEITNQVSDLRNPASDLCPLPSDLRSQSSAINHQSSAEPVKPNRLSAPVRITDQVWPEGTVPVVSVFCITYNHVNFIRDAIEGFLMQETTFPVEIFIHDDASSDGTAEIVKEYAEKYPKLFWTVLQTENQWSNGNKKILTDYLQKQRGEFIALCEGDDFWTSPRKLQEQVSFLEKNSHYALSFCNTQVVYTDERYSHAAYGNHLVPVGYYPVSPPPPETSKTENLSKSNYIHTSGAVLRNWLCSGYLEVQNYLQKAPVGDYALHLLTSRFGKIKYHPDIMAAYRVHMGGIHSMLPSCRKALIEALFFYETARSSLFDKNLSQVWIERSAKISAEAVIYGAFDGWDGKLTAMSADAEWVTKFLEEIRIIHQIELKRSENSYRNSASFRFGRSLLKPWHIVNKWFFK